MSGLAVFTLYKTAPNQIPFSKISTSWFQGHINFATTLLTGSHTISVGSRKMPAFQKSVNSRDIAKLVSNRDMGRKQHSQAISQPSHWAAQRYHHNVSADLERTSNHAGKNNNLGCGSMRKNRIWCTSAKQGSWKMAKQILLQERQGCIGQKNLHKTTQTLKFTHAQFKRKLTLAGRRCLEFLLSHQFDCNQRHLVFQLLTEGRI